MSRSRVPSRSEFIERANKIRFDTNLICNYIAYIYDNNKPPAMNSKAEYCTIICKFYEFVKKSISNIEIPDITLFIKSANLSDNRNSMYLNRLAEYVKFVDERADCDLKITAEEIYATRKTSSEITAPEKIKPLSYTEIRIIRDYLTERKRYKHLINFEMAYSFGLKPEAIKQCIFDNFDISESCFILDDGRKIMLPSYLKRLRDSDTEAFDSSIKNQAKYDGDSGSFILMSNFINNNTGNSINITHSNILASHKKYGVVCVVCGDIYPSEAEYWMLDDSDGKTMQLVCLACARKGDIAI